MLKLSVLVRLLKLSSLSFLSGFNRSNFFHAPGCERPLEPYYRTSCARINIFFRIFSGELTQRARGLAMVGARDQLAARRGGAAVHAHQAQMRHRVVMRAQSFQQPLGAGGVVADQ